MRFIFLYLIISLSFTVGLAFGQGGSKAKPQEIKFDPQTHSGTVNGVLSSGHEANYYFSAKKGQEVTIRSPRWNMFDFRVYSEENFPDGDFDSSPTYTFEIPETGDYLFFVRKKMASPRIAKFSMTITIN